MIDKLQIDEKKWINANFISSWVMVESEKFCEVCITMTNGDCHCKVFESRFEADIFLMQNF